MLWACVEDGFHVGSRVGDFLGYVDRQSDGSYVAFDARAVSIGRFDSLHDATSAVSAADSVRAPQSGPVERRGGVVL